MALGQDTAAANKQWPDAELNAWINDAARYVSWTTKCVIRETTITWTERQSEYAMPSDYIFAVGVVIASTGTAIELDRNPLGVPMAAPDSLGHRAASGPRLPDQCDDLGETARKLRFSPAPPVADSARVRYVAYAQSMDSDTATCELPLAHQLVVPQLAASLAWAKTRSADPYWTKATSLLQPLIRTREQVRAGGGPQ